MTMGDCLILALTKGETGASSLNLTSELILQLDEPNYVSSTIEKAADDVKFLFPDFAIPRVALSEELRQQMDRPEAEDRTLTIVTPAAQAKFGAEIRTAIEGDYIIRSLITIISYEHYQIIQTCRSKLRKIPNSHSLRRRRRSISNFRTN